VGDHALLGPEATRAALLHHLGTRPRWRALHFACHGIVDRDRPLLGALVLAPEEGDDGLLLACDLARGYVPADLVVLSAAETGVGNGEGVEGVAGLPRALLLAGAPRILASLWRVDDESTRALMVGFYAHWKGGTPAAEALALAQRDVRRRPRWRHPFYWAGWTLWGLAD
jgi:CHAT domain-containing protein